MNPITHDWAVEVAYRCHHEGWSSLTPDEERLIASDADALNLFHMTIGHLTTSY